MAAGDRLPPGSVSSSRRTRWSPPSLSTEAPRTPGVGPFPRATLEQDPVSPDAVEGRSKVARGKGSGVLGLHLGAPIIPRVDRPGGSSWKPGAPGPAPRRCPLTFPAPHTGSASGCGNRFPAICRQFVFVVGAQTDFWLGDRSRLSRPTSSSRPTKTETEVGLPQPYCAGSSEISLGVVLEPMSQF